jgi:hypothetical protein
MKTRANNTAYFIIAIAAAINLILHLVAGFNSGFHGDELLHIEAGRHLAFGYMDFGPFIAYLAYIQNLFHSDSIFVNHLFVYISSTLIFIISGLVAVRLGGSWRAVLIVMLCILFSPGFGASHSLFLPVVFEQLFWVACIYCLVSFNNSPQSRYLIGAGIFAALGFLSKYSIVFLIAGIAVSLLMFRRDLLKKPMLWLTVIVFLVLILPNVLWQLKNGFPVFHHFSKLYEVQLDSISRFGELKAMLLFLNPFTSVFWIAGLMIVPFAFTYRKLRFVAFPLLFAFLFLVIARGKSYYFFPIILCVLPFGAVYFEQLLGNRKWIIVSYLVVLVSFGVLIMPRGVSVLPLDTYINLYKIERNSDNKIPIAFENYYSKGIWNKVLGMVDKTYKSLPLTEQKQCLIWGRHYSQAGGINLLGAKMDLPEAFSFHSSFYNWVPEFTNKITVIVIADPEWDKEHWLRYFNEVEQVGKIDNQYNADKKWDYQSIFLCRKLKYNSTELKNIFKNEIY